MITKVQLKNQNITPFGGISYVETLFPQSRSLFVLLLFFSTFPFPIYAYIAIFVLSMHTFPLPNEGVHPRLALPKKARLRTVDF